MPKGTKFARHPTETAVTPRRDAIRSKQPSARKQTRSSSPAPRYPHHPALAMTSAGLEAHQRSTGILSCDLRIDRLFLQREQCRRPRVSSALVARGTTAPTVGPRFVMAGFRFTKGLSPILPLVARHPSSLCPLRVNQVRHRRRQLADAIGKGTWEGQTEIGRAHV